MTTDKSTTTNDPIVYINGDWTYQSKATVPFMDSGFWYGDGLFETLMVNNGHIFRPHKHLARMHEGMNILKIEFPVPEDEVIALMEELIRRNSLDRALLRLMCTRGTVPGAPYRYEGPTNLYIGLRYADPDPDFPVKVLFVLQKDYPVGRMVPALKSMTYLGNMLAIRDALAHDAFEPVFIDHDGVITECAVRNIFFVKDKVLHTPDTSLGILAGITRDQIIELAGEMGFKVDYSPIRADAVNGMDEAFITSTGIGIYPATWDGFHDSDYAITNRLREAAETQFRNETGMG